MKKFSIFIMSLFIIIIFMYFPDTVTNGALTGIKLCFNVIIPSLFPFCVICLFIIKSECFRIFDKIISPISNKFFSLSSVEFFIMIMSFLGGYPVGAKLINTLYNEDKIDKKTAKIMLCYCINAGPAFIIIAVGNCILNSKILGNILLISHILSSIIIAIFCSFFIKKKNKIVSKSNTNVVLSDAFVDSTAQACSSIISICSLIIIFSVIIKIFKMFNIHIISAYLVPLLEVTSGIIESKNIYIISALLGWGGICVHFQIFSICKEMKINKLIFYISRIAHSIFSILITYVQLKFSFINIETISNNVTFTNSFSSMATVYSSIFFILSSIVLVGSIYYRKY